MNKIHFFLISVITFCLIGISIAGGIILHNDSKTDWYKYDIEITYQNNSKEVINNCYGWYDPYADDGCTRFYEDANRNSRIDICGVRRVNILNKQLFNDFQ